MNIADPLEICHKLLRACFNKRVLTYVHTQAQVSYLEFVRDLAIYYFIL